MRILYIQYANPGAYPPIQHSSKILAENGYDVRIIGIRTRGTESLRFDSSNRVCVRLMRDCPPGLFQKLHYLGFCGWLIWTVLRWRPTWVYVSDALAAPVGYIVPYLRCLSTVYHEHDIPAEAYAPQRTVSLFMRFILRARLALARNATVCVAPNEARAARLKREADASANVLCVCNYPSLKEAKSAVATKKTTEELIVFFHGSIVPARLPMSIIHALAHCPAHVRFRFAGYETIGHRKYIERILTEAARIGVDSRISYLGALPRPGLLARCAETHVGLSLMPLNTNDINMTAMVGASNKPFDYLLCGVALLVSDLPDWNKAFVEPGFGLACNPEDPLSIARAFTWFADHPDQLREMGARGRERVLEQWNYETQFEPVRQMIIDGPAAPLTRKS